MSRISEIQTLQSSDWKVGRKSERERDGAALESFVANLRNTVVVVVCSDLSVQISRHGPSSHL